MRKRWLSLLLALVMLASVTVTTTSADTVNLSDKTVTLSVTPSQSAICVGSTGDVYVKYTISIEADVPIPAFQFRLPADAKLATQVQSNDSNWYYWFNTDELMQWDEAKKTGGHGPYKVADYTKSSGYVGVGGSDDGKGLTSVTVMTTVAKFEKNSITNSTTYDLHSTITDFVAGGAKDDGGVNTANPFGKCTVAGAAVTVNPGTTVSGTVKDSSGKAVSGATVELYKDGTKVADATAGTDGKYTISNVSTGTYIVKAKSSDGSLNGSVEITVKADSILNADVTVAKGFTVSGTALSWNNTNDALYYLYPSTMEDAAIKAEWKSGSYTGTVCTSKGTPTASGKQFEQTFTFDTIPEGNYKLVIFKPGKYVPKIVSITVGTDAYTCGQLKLWLYGDVTYDGIIDGTDAVQIKRQFAGKTPNAFTSGAAGDLNDRLLCADVNFDGVIDGTDAVQIQRHFAGKTPNALISVK